MRKRFYRLISGLLTAVMLAGAVGQIPAKAAVDNGWETVDGNSYWYENGVKQGIEGRGKEIYDPGSDAWYWLDSVDDGKKAVSKDVYQESDAGNWADRADGTGKWVRYDENGHMIKGWSTNENGTYYFDPIYGTMAKGYAVIDGSLHYFDKTTGVDLPASWDGINGWVVVENIDGNCYWYEDGVRQGYDPDNAAYRGKEIYDPESDAWYWLDNVDQGKKAVSKDVYQESLAGEWAENADGTGKWVRYDAQGHMIKGWSTNENGAYYFDLMYGTMAKGVVTIDGKQYEFDKTTGILLRELGNGDAGNGSGSNAEEYEYTQAVVEELVNTTDYRVEAKEGTEGELVLHQNENTSKLQQGDILVLPKTKEWQDGLILKVSKAWTENGEVRVTGEVPNDPLEVYESVSIQGTAQADLGNVSVADGVTFRIVENGAKMTGGMECDSLGLKGENVSLGLTEEFEIEELGTTVSMQIPEISYDIEYDKKGVKALNIELPNEIVIQTEISKEFSGEKELGSIPFELGAGFSVEVVLSLVCSMEGTASIELRLDNTVGVNYENGSLKYIAECIPSQTIALSADAKAGAKLDVGIYFAKGICEALDEFIDRWKGEDDKDDDIKSIYNVGAELGIGLNAELEEHVEVKLTCVDVGMHLYLDMYAGDGSFIGDTFNLKHTWNIWDEDNSPLKGSMHFEKKNSESLKKVEKCTYKPQVSLSKCTVTLSQSSYTYDGTAKKPTVTVKNGSTTIASGEYTVSYSNNVNVGTATVTITAKSGSTKVTGSTTKTFTIKSAEGAGEGGNTGNTGDNETAATTPLSSCTVTLSQNSYTYDGTAKEPTVTVKDSQGTVPSSEYIVSYKNNINVGIVTVTVTANTTSTRISGALDINFEITEAENSGRNPVVRELLENPGEVIYTETTYNGVVWTVYDSGLLTVLGQTDNGLLWYEQNKYHGKNPWFSNYRDDIIYAYVNVEGAKSARDLFYMCTKLEEIDLADFDTSGVEDMNGMFTFCSSLKKLDLSGFDTGSVTDTGGMFYACSSLGSLDVSGFETGKVTNMDTMFCRCSNINDLDVSSFDTSSVLGMNGMFSGCSGLSNLDLSGFDTNKVTDMKYMFENCSKLQEIKVGLGWTTENANITDMFNSCGTDHVTYVN